MGGNNGAADNIGMAANVLGGGMQHNVRAKRERLLAIWRGKRIVDHGKRAVLAGKCADRPNIGQLHQRIGRRFQPNHACFRPQCRADLVRVGHIHKIKDKSKLGHDPLEQAIGTAIHIVAHDHMIACLEHQHQGGGGAQTGRKGERVGAAFQGR